ncbi:DUF4256 domain-containing protein [Echinicola pacifica]|uniref:DUF4256 domain-containing protein n=1 Tax=Echinicola pacifica TaxID=346377 RepID=UPI00039F3BC1|nr:DUF4256 domain-containing protein [Echinicola pacifica]
MKNRTQSLSPSQQEELLQTLASRFEKFPTRHQGIHWEAVEQRLRGDLDKLAILYEMESTGGEPDLIGYDSEEDLYLFCDCSAESPAGRRSLCYDRAAWEARKNNKPKNTAQDLAAAIGIQIMDETQYQMLQRLGDFDTKTSSWLQTPEELRKRGGAIFGDRRFGRVFIYHNGADSYYAGRGFRGTLKL